MRKSLAFFIVLLACAANALFLVSEAEIGEPVHILCENQEQAIVSTPEAKSLKLALDSDFQAEFTPLLPGPYTIQCGKEATTIQIKGTGSAERIENNGAEFPILLAAASLVLMLFFLGAAALIARQLFSQKTEFRKTVENGKARIFLKAGKKLENVKICDPVFMGFEEKEQQFAIPLLLPGAEWCFEYEIKEQQKALPASLEAKHGKERVNLLSELYIGGKKPSNTVKKRRIARVK